MKGVKFLSLLAAVSLALALPACGSDSDGDNPHQDGDAGTEVTDSGVETDDAGSAGDADASAGEDDAGEEEEFRPKPVPQGDEGQMNACYVPSSFPSSSFNMHSGYDTSISDLDSPASYEFIAYDKYENGMGQSLWVEIYPESLTETLTGTFDLSKNDSDRYETCSRCIVIDAGASENQEKWYMPASGTLTLETVTSDEISGTISNAEFKEVIISEDALGNLSTVDVSNGCTTRIEGLSFSYRRPELPEHVLECLVPESFEEEAFTDYIYELTASAKNNTYFYRAIDMSGNGMPQMTLYVEAYSDAKGDIDLATTEDHYVIVETVMPDGVGTGYVATSGTLRLTDVGTSLMAGELLNVQLEEVFLSDDDFEYLDDPQCFTEIPHLAFSSANATVLED